MHSVAMLSWSRVVGIMIYSVVALRKTDNESAKRLVERLTKQGVRILFNGYAPRMWLVSYQGTASQLANLIWPDGVPENKFLLPEGIVTRISRGRDVNGYASEELWDLIDGN